MKSDLSEIAPEIIVAQVVAKVPYQKCLNE